MGRIVTLGEIMLRLSTVSGERIPQASHFEAHYGGGEANVAISLANYGHEVFFASKVPENPLGEAVKKHLARYGVNTQYLLTGGARLGTYYMEAGVSVKAASVIYDRAGSSFALMTENEWPEDLFVDVDIFHISGITPALSQQWQSLTVELAHLARQSGCKISFDINYRGKLWRQEEAAAWLKQMLPLVDYCSAGKLDALYLLEIPECSDTQSELCYYYEAMQTKYPNISVFYATSRQVISASANSLTGTMWMENCLYESKTHQIEPIVDRVGGGDAFAGGILHGLLTYDLPQETVEFATAASALKHTVYGDCNQFTETEIQQFLQADSGKIMR